ncbi:MAG: M48 family metallopeptidase, partial [Micromonosporaceae bacterium]
MATARAVLAVLLLLGFYVLALVQLVAVGGFTIWLGTVIPGMLALKVTWPVLAAVVGAVGLALWRAIRNKPEPPEGLPLAHREAPYLWDAVAHLARSVGTRMPDEIRLVPEVNAAVVEHTKLLGLMSGRRFLYIGVPLVHGMTIAQLNAVLAHELGHYSHSHTRLGAVAYRGRLAVGGTLERIGRWNPVRWVFHAYALLYLMVDSAVVRRQELEADRAAVRIAGREATGSALREIPVLDAAWGFYFTRYVKPSWDAGYVPDELFNGFGYLLAERQDELRELRMSVPDEQPSRWDTHPPIRDRLAAIGKAPVSGAMVDERPATLLLPNLDAHCRTLQAAVIDRGERTVVPWSELLTLTVRLAAEERVNGVLGAMNRAVPDAAPFGVDTILHLVAEGRLGELAQPLFPNATRREMPERFAKLLVPLLELAAVRSGVATWRHSWS